MNRRKFFKDTALAGTGLMVTGNAMAAKPERRPNVAPRDIMAEVKKYRKIDAHAHVFLHGGDSPEWEVGFAERLNITKLVASKPVARNLEANPDQFRECNNMVLGAMKKAPDHIIGQMTLNPRFQKESLEEINRCIGEGMVGLKLYSHVKINDPLFFPIIEKFIDLKMIILMHVGIGESRVIFSPIEVASTSIAKDFVDVAARYPEAMFQFAHLSGGGDWEEGVKTLKHSPNVFVDVSGSNNDANVIDFAMQELGEDRIFFGCDNSFHQGVGHVLAANLTETQRRKIFFDNYNKILKKSGNHVD